VSRSREPFRQPAAWDLEDCPSKESFCIDLEAPHVNALQQALAAARWRGRGEQDLSRDDFPLDAIAEDLARWREEVYQGRGLVILRGFPVHDLDVESVGLMYLGLGLHFGTPVSQSNMGERVGHVINVGGQDARERAYRNARELHLHTDRCDHVAMLCIRPAWKGGVSGYASALTIHNRMLAERPDLLEPLYRGYYLHRFGEQPPGESPITTVRIPVYSITDGVPSVIYIRGYIDIAEQEGHVALEPEEREALVYFEEVASREDVRLDFTLQAGELSLFNNCVLLHTRTAFEDPPHGALGRHLVRLWLMEEGRPAADGVKAHKGMGGITPLPGKGTYYAERGRPRTG
jgi:hypothetical protein